MIRIILPFYCLVSYFIGAIPFGFIVVKIVKGIDIRRFGSKNIGATNVARALGTPFFFVVFSLDMLKGFLPVFFLPSALSNFMTTAQCDRVLLFQVLCGVAVILGQIFPVYLKFKGGKGVAISIGVILALDFSTGLVMIGIWLILFVVSGYVSLSSIIAAISLPVIFLFLDKEPPQDKLLIAIFFLLIGIIVIVRHIPNIKRLLKGVETKIKWKKVF